MSTIAGNIKKAAASSLGVMAVAASLTVGGAGSAVAQPAPRFAEDFNVCWFLDADYEGPSWCGIKSGELPPQTAGLINFTPDQNDKLSSIGIKPGYTVRLYVDANAQGASVEVTNDVANFTNLRVDLNDLSVDLNDTVSSLVVSGSPR